MMCDCDDCQDSDDPCYCDCEVCEGCRREAQSSLDLLFDMRWVQGL